MYITSNSDFFSPVKDGKYVYSEVRTFLKRQPYKNATYRTLTTEQGNHVTMTDNHLLFVSTNNKSTDMEARYIFILQQQQQQQLLQL